MYHKKHFILFKNTIILTFVTFILFSISFISSYGIIGIATAIRTIFMYRSEKKRYDKYHVFEDEEKFIIDRGKESFTLYKNKIKKIKYDESRFTKEVTLRINYSISDRDEVLLFAFDGLKRSL